MTAKGDKTGLTNGTCETQDHPAYLLHGQAGARGPIVIAVPHAGRIYPPSLLARARVPQEILARLEDRLADQLAAELIAQGHHTLIARHPRALIDLNRDEREVDLRAISGAPWSFRSQPSAKVRGGLGLVPERLAQFGSLWRAPLPYEALMERVEEVHRPYHAALENALETTRQRHGVALLLDIHSMPPLRSTPGMEGPPPRIVIGDRFGRCATDRLTDLCADMLRRQKIPVAINSPYSGNHILERHGRPDRGVHAIQIEIDRTLYLDNDLMAPGPGLAAMQQLLADLVAALTQELAGPAWPLAAE